MSDFLPPAGSPPDSPNPPPSGSGQSGGFGGPPGGGGYGPPPGGEMHAPPPKPGMSSNMKGCLIALAVLFGIGALCTCTGVGLVSYGIYSNPEARRAFGAVGDVMGLVSEGMADPGAQAMVGAGCQEAMALPLARLFEVMREIDPENAPAQPDANSPELIVSCTLRGSANATCEMLAQTFVMAHQPPPRSFALTVQSMNGQVCANLYGPRGELIRPLGADEQYEVPNGAPPMGQPPSASPPPQ